MQPKHTKHRQDYKDQLIQKQSIQQRRLNQVTVSENFPQTPVYVTLKHHKDNFRSSPLCLLINLSKSKIGKKSKILLENINKNLLPQLIYNQSKNTNKVIHWFSNINVKQKCKFIQLDIKEFYPFISEETLNKAINFAENFTSISHENIPVIKDCRKSILFDDNESWKKKEHSSLFDVTIGSYDGVELSEQIGIYIYLVLLESTLEKDQMGLQRDDVISFVISIANKRTNIRKMIISIDLKIEITRNLTEADYLDVPFNLERHTYRQFKKPNNNLTYTTPYHTIHHKSLNTSLKLSVEGYPEILQVPKYVNNQIQITKKHGKNVVTKLNCNTYNQICTKITLEEEH